MNKKLELIVNGIESKNGKEILVLDFEGKNSLCDYTIICTGSSNRNIMAIAEEVEKQVKDMGEEKLSSEGKREGKWILIDCDDVMVHVFDAATREEYKLEALWNGAKELLRK